MTFLLNFVHFEAIFADSETDFANFETKESLFSDIKSSFED